MGTNTPNENTNIAIKGEKDYIAIDGGARVGSDAVIAGGRFFSGGIQGRPDLDTGSQARDAFEAIGKALKAGDYEWSDVVDVWILLADTRDFADVASVYREIFTSNPPATSVVGIQPTGRGAVQIQVIAVK